MVRARPRFAPTEPVACDEPSGRLYRTLTGRLTSP